MPNTSYPPQPTEPVRFEVMRMWWNDLCFMHWPYDPEHIQSLLPDDLVADTWAGGEHDGAVWVGLVPFRMTVGFPGGLRMPKRVGVFPETNVRTYVRDRSGRPGVWFCSLEAGGLLASATARLTYGLPYFWADMSIEQAHEKGGGETWSFESTRRWPGPKGAHHASSARVGEPVAPDEVTPFEHYLTARWGLYSTFAGRTLYAPVDHGVWPLQRAELLHLDDGLIEAAGLPAPAGDPIVHWTAGTEVRIGRPSLVRS